MFVAPGVGFEPTRAKGPQTLKACALSALPSRHSKSFPDDIYKLLHTEKSAYEQNICQLERVTVLKKEGDKVFALFDDVTAPGL